MLVNNDTAGSGGDYFSSIFKRFKLGPVIGKRPHGGLVGILSLVLMKGGNNVAQDPVARDAYVRAERMLPWNRDRVLFNADLDVFWIEGSDALWYKSTSETGWQFIVVDAATRTRRPAFDHARMAEALGGASGTVGDANHLPISRLEFRRPNATPRVFVKAKAYDCDLTRPACVEALMPRRAADRAYAPDGRQAVFAKGPNLWVENLTTGRERPLTIDGEPLRAYCAFPGLAGPVLRQRTGAIYPPGALTEGKSVVRELLGVDEKTSTVIFSDGGRDPALDPYLRQLYQVGFDGRGLRRLAAEPADHQVRVGGRQFLGVNQVDVPAAFSSSGRFFVDAYSRVDFPTVTVVRDRTGRPIMTLETARLDSSFAQLYSPPEPFRALASDGVTAVYGIIIKPSNFDSARRYPVLDAVYGGPQTVYVPKRFGGDLNGLYGRSFAELGSVAVVVDGRNTPFRSRAFFDAGYGHLGKGGFIEDHVSAIREIARSRAYLDLTRVGVFGFSAGGYAVIRAMFDHPDFYAVGIETALYDPMLNEWSWGQKYQGPYDAEGYAKQAPSHNVANFKGKLFMAIGDVDDVVNPAATMRVVDQLIRHDKDFDLLVVPNQDHNLIVLPYLIRRQWDYFVANLVGTKPPPNYTIAAPAR